jgi:hypothetical protein
VCVCVCVCMGVYVYVQECVCVRVHALGNFSPCGRRTYKSNFGLARRARPKFKKLTPGVPEKM